MTNRPLRTGWATVRLRDVGTWVGGGTPSKRQPAYWTNGTIPWVSPKDMKKATLHGAEDRITARAVEESTTQVVPAGSVLVVTRSGILRHSLPVAVNAVPVALNQDLKAIIPREGIDATYLAWALRAFEPRILHECSKAGTTVQSIEMPKLQNFELPVAPLAEQHRIVAMLEEYLSHLDAGMAGLRRSRANLDRYQASVLDTAVAGELLREGELSDGPWAGWRTSTLGEVADIQGGIQKQPKRAPANNHYPYLRVANVLRGRLVLDEVHRIELFGNELQRLRLQRGDLLIVEGNGSAGEIGRMAVWDGSIPDCVHQNHIIRARPHAFMDSGFLALFWNSPTGRRIVQAAASSTSGLHTLSVAKVSRMPVPVPPLAQQRAIVAEAERRLLIANRTATDIVAQLARATRLRRSLLKHAFDGQMLPRGSADTSQHRSSAQLIPA